MITPVTYIIKTQKMEDLLMVFTKVQEIIAEQLGKDTDDIKMETNIQEELGGDSLDLFQIINDIEDEFDVKIETEEGITTVGDLVKFVETEQAK